MLIAGDGDLVTRGDLLGRLLDSGSGTVWDVRGTPGAGKSVLLRQVARQAGPKDVVVLLEMQHYHTPFEPAGGAADGSTRVGQLRRLGQVASAVVRGSANPGPSAQRAVGVILRDIAAAAHEVEELDEAGGRQRVGVLIEGLGREVNGLLAATLASGRRAYLLCDTFDAVLGQPLGGWLLDLFGGLDRVVVAVARRGGSAAVPLPMAGRLQGAAKPVVLPVDNLAYGQVRDYLTRRLGSLGAEVADLVHQVADGHALTVGLTADLISDLRRFEPVTPESLGRLLAGRPDPFRPGDLDVQLGTLVGSLVRSARDNDPEIADGLDRLWPLRRFDFPLLERLLGPGAHRLAERLVGYSFIQRHVAEDRPTEHYYVLHDQVRVLLERASREPGRAQEVHREAEAHYRQHTEDFLAGYAGWFRYSDASWQVLVREWLYHVAHLEDAQQVDGRRGIAKLFFDTFWWWGNYMSFPFCEKLLADWAEMAAGSPGRADDEWGAELSLLYVTYPKGWRARERAPRDQWQAVREHLRFFWESQEIRDAGPDHPHMRQLRGQLALFLAVAERYLNPGNEKAASYFRESHELLIADDNAWDAAWVTCHEADAALGHGDLDGALAAADRAWDELTELDDDDFELAANLHRIHADAAWAGGEHGLALDLYARAVLSAYKFQVDVSDPDIPPLVEYTQAFMAEMHERTVARLRELRAAGEDAAIRAAAERIRRFFAPYWRGAAEPADVGRLGAAEPAELVEQLFPPVPPAGDLHQPDTAYTLTASEVLYDMDEELTEPPGTPLPESGE